MVRQKARQSAAGHKPVVTPGSRGAVLLVEDDRDAIEQLTFRLKREGYAVSVARNASRAALLGARDRFDVIIMDYFLPDGDGEAICSALRAGGIDTPILMLTARRALEGKISALDRGADDYLTKPFAFEELFARLRALTRRGRTRQADVLAVGEITVNRGSRTASIDGRRIELSPLEFDLLTYLLENSGRAISRQEILSNVWAPDRGTDREASTNTVDVYIRYLRKKIWGGRRDSPIRTVRGAGYEYRI